MPSNRQKIFNMKDYFSLISEPVFYVTPDPIRAIGLENVLPNFHIVCLDKNDLVDLLKERGVKIFSLEEKIGKDEKVLRNTGSLLSHPLVQDYIKNNAENPNILFFKPSKKVETIIKDFGWKSLGNNSELNNLFEDKISFHNFCKSCGLPVPQGEINYLNKLRWEEFTKNYGEKLVFQFGHGWAGNTTYFINKRSDFDNLISANSNREVRLTKFIEGDTYLNNACVTRERILMSAPALQITAPLGFTLNPGGTCGRVWPAANLSPESLEEINTITLKVGEKMREMGYRGFFGLDFIVDKNTDKVYISENNARLTASTPMYTKLELKHGKIPLLFFHILEFLEKEQPIDLSVSGDEEIRGSELILRNAQKETMTVTNNFPQGIYINEDGKLVKIRDGISIEDIKKPEEFFLAAVGKGREVTSENEIARLDTLDNIVDENEELVGWVKDALLSVKKQLAPINLG